MTNETNAKFLAALPARLQEDCAEALKNVTAAEVYNADYVEAKFIFGRSVDEAWDALKVPYSVYCEVGSVMCLHDIISMSKKVAKLPSHAEGKAAMSALCDALLPVALLMKDLKAKTIKARKPASAEVLAERAAKEASKNRMARATCGCCFGEQAVLDNGRIHDHGYTLPSNWMKTKSCYGRQFRPLEVSDEGPRFMVKLATEAEKHMVEALANMKAAVTLQVATKYEQRHGLRVPVEFKDIDSSDPQFTFIKSERVNNIIADLGRCRRDLAKYNEVVANWKAV